jgi:hypothetical protein
MARIGTTDDVRRYRNRRDLLNFTFKPLRRGFRRRVPCHWNDGTKLLD